ncbi:MAG: hypothetical protein [Caudoviricetes sp.]|nr:MAG: hypothetical protein [Caudoviricetes sp.]
MAKIFRSISEARLVNFHFGSLANWTDRKLKLHAKLFRTGHYIYSIRDDSDRYIYTEFSVKPNHYPALGTIVIDKYRGKVVRINRNTMVKAALGKSGSYPSVDKSVSYNTDSKLSLVWNVIKLLVK